MTCRLGKYAVMLATVGFWLRIGPNTRPFRRLALAMHKYNPLGKLRLGQPKLWLLVGVALTLVACGGGGGSDGGGTPTNRSPVANAGSDQNVLEMSLVQLAGSGSDPDAGDTLTFAWSQTAGTAVTLSSTSSASPSFNAPDVTAGTPEVLTFRLTVSDSAGLSSSDNVLITVQEPAAVVTISGNLRYEFPPPRAACDGLNFNGVLLRPMRQVTVQLLNATGTTVLDTAVSDDNGAYSLSANASTDVIVRVRAELKKSGSPSWDVEVRNNVDTDPNPVPLNQRPLYVMDSSVFDSGVTDQTLDLTAETGWGGSGFTGNRVAAPFSVLDAIYSAMQLIAAQDPTASFDALDAFWSPDNVSSRGSGTIDEDIASGEIGTSFYSADRLFLLGRDGDDIEEFDDHVIVHEWGHYFEDNFSRSDSIGGAHGIGDRLDMRVAFGEGWATALSGIALDNPTYCDTFWSGNTLRGFRIDIESGNTGTEGWFNELSIVKLIYDLWDTDNDGADNASIGFGPIYDVMTGPQTATAAFTSIFTFATELKLISGQDAFIDALLAEHDIVSGGIDIYGSTETNDGPGTTEDVLPVYTTVIPDGSTINICSNSQFDDVRDGNKLSEHRFLRMNISVSRRYRFEIMTTTAMPNPDDPADERDQSDPDILIYLDGQLQNRVVGGVNQGLSGEANQEIFTTPNNLAIGDYVLDFNEFRFEDEETTEVPNPFPERVCFDVTVTPA